MSSSSLEQIIIQLRSRSKSPIFISSCWSAYEISKTSGMSSVNSASAKELYLATGLPLSSSMESTALLQKWFLERGNKISPIIGSEKVDNIAGLEDHKTGDFEKPDHTPGLVIRALPEESAQWNQFLERGQEARKTRALSGEDISRLLYSFARNLQKHQGIISLVLCVDAKRNINECKKHDVPLAIQTVYHFAGFLRPTGLKTTGEVSCVVPSVLSPLLDVVNHFCAGILAGRPVLMVPSLENSRTAAVIMDVLMQSGLPPGWVMLAPARQLPSEMNTVSLLQICSRDVIKSNAFVATLRSESLRNFFCPSVSRSTAIVTDTADVESAVASVFDASVFFGGKENFSLSKILVQETIVEKVTVVLKEKMATFRFGSHLDKSVDYTSVISKEQAAKNKQILADAGKEGVEIVSCGVGSNQAQAGELVDSPLILARKVSPTSGLLSGEYCGPVLCLIPFRTIKEAVALANNGSFGSFCSLWSENISAAMEISRNVKTSTVWINAHHLYDAAVGAGGSVGSGWPVVGKDAVYDFLYLGGSPGRVSDERKLTTATPSVVEMKIDRTYKMYYGGAQKRPENGVCIPVTLPGNGSVCHIPDGGQKDLKNAVDSAIGGATTWSKTAPFSRSQILFYIAENFSSRTSDFSSVLESVGLSRQNAEREVARAVDCLFFWAGQCDKNNGEVLVPSTSMTVLHLREPLGVVAAVLLKTSPLLSLANVVGATLAFGNSIIAIPSLTTAVVALEFSKVLETSDVPAGVVNIVTGQSQILYGLLWQHPSVAAVWSFDSSNQGVLEGASKEADALQVGSLLNGRQRLWKVDGSNVDWESVSQNHPDLFRHFATQHKRIWLPSLESFAN